MSLCPLTRGRLIALAMSAAALAWLVAPAPAPGAAAAPKSPEIVEGRAALAAGDTAAAEKIFHEAWWAAQRRGDTPKLVETCFYLGVTHAVSADKLEGPARAEALGRAVKWYEMSRKESLDRPGGALLNNLAQAELKLGRGDEAVKLLSQAVGLNDERRDFYVANLADLTAGRGDWQGAARLYRLVALKPGGEAAQDRLFDLYDTNQPGRIPLFLDQLTAEGWLLRAEKFAASAAAKHAADDTLAAALLARYALSLSRQRYDPATYDRRDTAKQLEGAGAAGRPAAQAVAELRDLHLAPSKLRGRELWWSRPDDRGVPAAAGHLSSDTTRVGAFRALARSLGGAATNAPSGADAAEVYYRLAIELVRDDPDPDAMLALTDLFLGQKRPDRVAALADEYNSRLYAGKGGAYGASDWQRVYKYHRALGVMYSNMGKLTGGVASAEFQLDRAFKAAERWNSQHAGAGAAIGVEPRLVEMLAMVYERSSAAGRAIELRLAAADRAVRQGDAAAARAVLEPLDAGGAPPLAPEFAKRLASVKGDLLALQGPGKTIEFPKNAPFRYVVKPGAQLWTGELSSKKGRMTLVGSEKAAGAPGPSGAEAAQIAAAVDAVLAGGPRPGGRVIVGKDSDPVPDNIFEINFDGTKGNVLVNLASGPLNIPFVFESADGKTAPGDADDVHYLRPGKSPAAPGPLRTGPLQAVPRPGPATDREANAPAK